MKKKIRVFLLVTLMLLLSCATGTQFSCELPEGKEYSCYSDKEYSAYINGYYSSIAERFKDRDRWGWYPEKIQVKYINLWVDHKNFTLLGRIEAERKEDGRIYIKVWTEAYDMECKLLDKGYDEGYMDEGYMRD